MNMPNASRWRGVTRVVFYEADTTTIRALLGSASAVFAFMLVLNVWMGQHIMDRSTYRLMKIWGGDFFWASLFFLHYAGVVWRIYATKACVWCAVAVNAFGFILWSYGTAAIGVSIGFLSPTSALELTICAASGWALYRTGLRDEVVTP